MPSELTDAQWLSWLADNMPSVAEVFDVPRPFSRDIIDRLRSIAARLERPAVEWPSDESTRLRYDSFSDTWTVDGATAELTHEQAVKVLGREPKDREEMSVTVTINPAAAAGG